MSGPSWQEELRQRLIDRNAKEAAYAGIIEQYRRLVQQTRLLKERNASLLRAVGSVRSNPNSSTVIVGAGGDDNPVRAAYIVSLESQISSLRDEMAAVYKTHGQNAQRLFSMTETLREKEELLRVEGDNLRKLTEEITHLRRKVDQHNELMSEKDRTAQVLHDEIATLQLELGQIEERNASLVKDNAVLLQRWLDAKQADANRMNEANEFYDQMRSRSDAIQEWRNRHVDGSDSASILSGNEDALAIPPQTRATDGKGSQPAGRLTLTPNG
ncbi:ATG16-domain-containing protein [Sistotremastrum niveocremeum HHB9708]|uniref:ATG16-domain-containing protein n=2 Tax=Sistotremastraceae TaxID=3402574 RepID=A0A164XBX8_9AGAM|nr:ATG16-domain-containing protein [Sistotremastrum niveocremeum HHB9708]KZT36610.1 ATG16-domain-containing protein [Sistotremastrum suecicum HHB10207 ss-3]